MGRRSTLTKEVQDLLAAELERGHFRKRACALVGVPLSTFNDWIREGSRPDATDEAKIALVVAVEEAEAKFQNNALTQLNLSSARDPRIILTILARRFPEEWGRHDNVSITSTDNKADEMKQLRERVLAKFERMISAPPPPAEFLDAPQNVLVEDTGITSEAVESAEAENGGV